MKFIHAADLHIGRSRTLPNYLERQGTMLSEIYRLATEAADSLVLLGGDIYDRFDLLPREKDLFLETICKADSEGVTTVVINGNHDMIDEDDGGYTHLRSLRVMVEQRRLRRTHVIETNPQVISLPSYNINVIGVPAYYRKEKEVSAIVRAHLKRIPDADKAFNIALVHETVTGSTNDHGKPFEGVTLDPKIPIDYWALGDIHKPQSIAGIPHAWYSGSPIQHDFGDDGKRGVLIVDTDKPNKPKLVMLEGVKPLVTVKVDDTDDAASVQIPTDALVRVEGTKQKLAELTLPSNVVRTKPVVDAQAVSKRLKEKFADNDVLDGLVDILAELGMSADDQKWCLQEAERLR